MTGNSWTFLHPTDRRRKQRKRYGSRAWERTRAFVLERDLGICQVPRGEVGAKPAAAICGRPANVADHIIRPEEWPGGEDDPACDRADNLRAACRSCNMKRHNAAYFRQKADAAAAGPILQPVASGKPEVDSAAFIAWAMSLPGVGGEPTDHDHRRWSVAVEIHHDHRRFRICPADCQRAPVRWPSPPTREVAA